MSASGATTQVVAIREKHGGIIGLNTRLVVHADGTLNVLDRESGKDEEIRKLPQERVRPLMEAVSRPEWQEVESSYGEPQVFYLEVEGGDKRTVIEHPSEIGSHSPVVPIPRILEEVLEQLEALWRTEEYTVEPPAPAG
jgi:hypothetical protein